jgi:hypothetical protein
MRGSASMGVETDAGKPPAVSANSKPHPPTVSDRGGVHVAVGVGERAHGVAEPVHEPGPAAARLAHHLVDAQRGKHRMGGAVAAEADAAAVEGADRVPVHQRQGLSVRAIPVVVPAHPFAYKEHRCVELVLAQ